MRANEATKLLSQTGALLTGHFVFTSDRHGDRYFNKDVIYSQTEVISALCLMIAKQFAKTKVEVVIAPAIGGVILTQWVAHHLTKILAKEVLAVYAEKAQDGETFVVKRGYDKLIPKKRILVVEDVLTTGGSVKKVVELTRQLGGEVVGLGVLCNRGAVSAEDVGGVDELFALVKIKAMSWSEDECPLCRQNVPINTKVGKGREFLARNFGVK